MDNIFQTPEYKRSRKAYVSYCTFEYFITILIGDVFLAKLLTYAGMEDWLIGIISSIVSLACLFQLFSLLMVGKVQSFKKTIMIFAPLSQLLFMTMFVVPFLPVSSQAKSLIITILLVAAYFFHYLIASMIFKWANSFVNPKERGVFSAGKEMISLAAGIIFTLAVGYVVDTLELMNNLRGGFLFIAGAILVCSAVAFISLVLIKKRADHLAEEEKKEKHSLRDVMNNTLGNKSFRSIVIMSSMWNIARYLTLGFMGIFKTKELLLSVTVVQVINMAANILRLIVSKPFGKYSDKTSYASGIRLALIITAIGFAANMFTNENWIWGVVIFTIFYNAGLAGSNQNEFNITYSYVKSDYIAQALAIKASIGGVCGFAASLIGSQILAYVQESGNMFLGIPMYGQQLLSAISLVIIIITILFLKFVIEKQETVEQ